MTSPPGDKHTLPVHRAALRHQRALSVAAFALLALIAELVGRSLAHRIDVGRHVHSGYAHTDYYPFLLAAVKGGVALMLARVTWRTVRARATARAGRRLARALGHNPEPAPRMRLELSPRLWLTSFAVTSGFYLVQMDAEEISTGRWPLLAPWLHTSALPVFAVLAVVVALVYGAAARWLAAYERYAQSTLADAQRLAARGAAPAERRAVPAVSTPPRRRFGQVFESRPPPAPA